MVDIICQVAVCCLSFTAIFLIARKNRWGFVFGLASQPFWFITTYVHQQWGIFFLNVVYTFNWSYGIYNWFWKREQPESGVAIVYGSTPSRLAHKTDEIMKFVANLGKACLHPFKALPYDYYEGGCVGRDRTIEVCCKLIDACNEFAIFGISEGCLIELEYHLNLNARRKTPQPLLVFVKEFDPDWQKYFELFHDKYPCALTVLKPFLFS
jgi:hypothetical protein